MSTNNLQPFALPAYIMLSAPQNVRSMIEDVIAEANAHYEAQVCQIGGLARPDGLARTPWNDDEMATIAAHSRLQAKAHAVPLSADEQAELERLKSLMRSICVPARLARPDGVGDDGPTIAQMEAGAQALRDCGYEGATDKGMMAPADSVWRAMQEVQGAPVEAHNIEASARKLLGIE